MPVTQEDEEERNKQQETGKGDGAEKASDILKLEREWSAGETSRIETGYELLAPWCLSLSLESTGHLKLSWEKASASMDLVAEPPPRRQLQTMPTLQEVVGTATGRGRNEDVEQQHREWEKQSTGIGRI